MATIRVIEHYSDFSLIPKSLKPAFLRSKPVNQICQKATPESITEQAVQACRDTKLHESLSYPYMTRHVKRFGDYVLDLQNIPQPLETAIHLPIEVNKSKVRVKL